MDLRQSAFGLEPGRSPQRRDGPGQPLVHWVEPGKTTDYKSTGAFTAVKGPLDAHSEDIKSGAGLPKGAIDWPGKR